MGWVALFCGIGLACLICATLNKEIQIWEIVLPSPASIPRARVLLAILGVLSLAIAGVFFVYREGGPASTAAAVPTPTGAQPTAKAGPGAPPTGPSSPGTAAGYTQTFSRTRVTVPAVNCYAEIDLDTPAVAEGLNSLPGADLRFGAGSICGPDQLQGQEAKFFGHGPAAEPTGEQCAGAAKAQASGPVLNRAMTAGETAFCVITDQENVAWVQVTEVSRETGHGLALAVTLWTPNP
ncbi:hypothetical protein Lfu02_38680 [Longispora fulva]|uniref:Uncharacterized protein n=1 Tax=Longispora fulva TaxID=619741 RepID=A0A8J7GKP1_9ACTN|nr:hypothetical protein [Longispora fulva]MBG6141354.1 hypothetical protein [Longispora fulva]GIG59496.1 hypothetical protein Lfu02_38680 [Longispora fulva]